MLRREHLNKVIILMSVVFLFISCTKTKKEEDQLENELLNELKISTFNEPYRPQYHFTPQEKWMNDPNGLVYHKGIYHLFYQYYPDDIVWGPMHWGHAVSKDMIHWEHKPIALYPDELGLIFSGSAVVDKENSSGFGSKENPPLVAIFTYHLMEGEKAGRTDFQTQGIAYSLDNGDTWEKYEGNPVIGNDGIKDFRDPKVFWHEDTKRWIMALVAGDHAKFYESTNLKEWNHISDFGKDKGAHGGVWECPDLFKLKVEGSDEEKWVLIISINPGAPNGGSGTQYFIGNFDGEIFTTEHDDIRWLDYGTDNYAGVTYNNDPNGDRVFIGWMSNWNYARNTPTKVWRSAMTLPRKLSLLKEGAGYYLKNIPVAAVDKILDTAVVIEDIEFSNEPSRQIENEYLNESKISFMVDASRAIRLEFSNNSNDSLILELSPEQQRVYLNRTNCGIVDFEKSFGAVRHQMPFSGHSNRIPIDIYLDRSSIEVFIDDGRYVMTDQIFPNEPLTRINITGNKDQHIENFRIEPISSIWNEK